MRSACVVLLMVSVAVVVFLSWHWTPTPPTETGIHLDNGTTFPAVEPVATSPLAPDRTPSPPADEPAPHIAKTVRVVDVLGSDIPQARVLFRSKSLVVDRIAGGDGRVEAPSTAVDDIVVSAKGHATCRLPASCLAGAQDVVVCLPNAASMRVEVVDNEGHLVRGQLVELAVEDPVTPQNRNLLERVSGRTDDRGTVVFEDLGAAQYWLIVHEWRKWSGADLYGIEPIPGQTAFQRAHVLAKPAAECLEVTVRDIDPKSWGPASEHPILCIEIENRSGLERLHPPGEATVISDTGRARRVRLVAVDAANAVTPLTEWQTGVMGQSRPVELRVPAESPTPK